MRTAFAKSPRACAGGAFVRAKHNYLAQFLCLLTRLIFEMKPPRIFCSKWQRQNKVHFTGAISQKDAGFQKVFRSQQKL